MKPALALFACLATPGLLCSQILLPIAGQSSGYPVDFYLSMDGGANGDAITTGNMNVHGACTPSVGGTGSHQTISTASPPTLPRAVKTGGVTYTASPSKSYSFNPSGDTVVQYGHCGFTAVPSASYGFDFMLDDVASNASLFLSIVGGFLDGSSSFSISHWSAGVLRIATGGGTGGDIIPAVNTHYWLTGLWANGGTFWLYGFDTATWTLMGTSSLAGSATNVNVFIFGRNGADASPGAGNWHYGTAIGCTSGFGTYCGFPLVPHVITLPPPIYDHTPGTYANSVTVALSDILPVTAPVPPSYLYCVDTANTCTPNTSGSSVTISSVGANFLRSVATATGWKTSSVSSSAYTITSGPGLVSACANVVFGAGTTGVSCSLGAVSVGNYIALGASGGTAPIVTDNCNTGGTSNTYTLATGRSYYAVVGANTGTCTVTLKWTGSATGIIAVQAISNVTAIDKSADGNQFGTPTSTDGCTTASVTTTVNGEYIMAYTMATGGDNAVATAGTGYTMAVSHIVASVNPATEYKIQSTAGAIAAKFTVSVSGTQFNGIMTFKP